MAYFMSLLRYKQGHMKKVIAGIIMLVAICFASKAQEMDAETTQGILDSKNYVFKAKSATPQRGQVRHLTSEYDLVIKKDSVIAWLPFFGRSYEATINSEGGIKFTSTDFAYTIEKAKKKKWEITIKPKDAPDIQQVFLTVFDNGEATLQVLSTNKESMSFHGHIVEGKMQSKKGF